MSGTAVNRGVNPILTAIPGLAGTYALPQIVINAGGQITAISALSTFTGNIVFTGTSSFSGPITISGTSSFSGPITISGTLTVNAASAAYAGTYGGVAGIKINNTNAAQQTSIDFATNGVLSGRVRSDYEGNISLVATGSGVFYFYTGGDFATGVETAVIGANSGVGANTFTNIPTTQSITFANASGQSYGSIAITGSAASYAGIKFSSAYGSQGRTLMVSDAAAVQGFYDTNASAWDWYFSSGAGIVLPSGMAAGSGTEVIITSGGLIEKLSSSARYKLNIEDLKPADADKVLQLRPVSFTLNPKTTSWGTDPSTVHFGLIAEEVAEIIPNLVNYEPVERPHHTNDENGKPAIATHKHDGTPYNTTMRPESVQYSRLTVLLLDVIKRLSARVAALEEKHA